MNLRKLSPSMLLALGLVACGDDKGNGSDTAVDACLSPPIEETEAGPCLGMEPTTDDSLDDGISTTVGPCLSPPEPETSTTSSGTDSGSDTGTGSGSGSGTDSGSGSGSESGTSGGMEAPPESRDAALRRVMDNLPPDVAARLKGKG